MLYRVLGHSRVKLKTNTPLFWESIEKAKLLIDSEETIDPKFLNFILNRFNLESIGYDIRLFFTSTGVNIGFILEQYVYRESEKRLISAQEGDVVIDAGACWGDSALYFANRVGPKGKVYSFEFIPRNIEIYRRNADLNPQLNEHIELITHPLSNISDQVIYYRDNGPGSSISSVPFQNSTGITTTLSIDDFVKKNNLIKVDYIKMDIEGAELLALQGAINTIRTHKPDLAVAIYHRISDFASIPNWILDLNLGYTIFIDHFTIHSEETVCFATIKERE